MMNLIGKELYWSHIYALSQPGLLSLWSVPFSSLSAVRRKQKDLGLFVIASLTASDGCH